MLLNSDSQTVNAAGVQESSRVGQKESVLESDKFDDSPAQIKVIMSNHGLLYTRPDSLFP